MMRKIFVLSCLFASLNVQAQHADARISQLMNESRWFDLAQELKTTPADSVTPWVRQMGVAMTHYFFNRPDSACMVLTDFAGQASAGAGRPYTEHGRFAGCQSGTDRTVCRCCRTDPESL